MRIVGIASADSSAAEMRLADTKLGVSVFGTNGSENPEVTKTQTPLKVSIDGTDGVSSTSACASASLLDFALSNAFLLTAASTFSPTNSTRVPSFAPLADSTALNPSAFDRTPFFAFEIPTTETHFCLAIPE
jgi:hypothetical protein